MILVDTSVWIDHLRSVNDRLDRALNDGEVLTHPYVIGELACGNIRNRGEIMRFLHRLPLAREATHREVVAMIEGRKLMGVGIGYADAHLLAATALTPSASLWTHDKQLSGVARKLGLTASS